MTDQEKQKLKQYLNTNKKVFNFKYLSTEVFGKHRAYLSHFLNRNIGLGDKESEVIKYFKSVNYKD